MATELPDWYQRYLNNNVNPAPPPAWFQQHQARDAVTMGAAYDQSTPYVDPREALQRAQAAALTAHAANEAKSIDLNALNQTAELQLKKLGIDTTAAVQRENIGAENSRAQMQNITALRGQDLTADAHKAAAENDRLQSFIAFTRDHPDISTKDAADAIGKGGFPALASLLGAEHQNKINAKLPALISAFDKAKIDKSNPDAVNLFLTSATGGDHDLLAGLKDYLNQRQTNAPIPAGTTTAPAPGYNPNLYIGNLPRTALALGTGIYNATAPAENVLRSVAGAQPRKLLPPVTQKQYDDYVKKLQQ